MTAEELLHAPLVQDFLCLSLEEDVGSGDITTRALFDRPFPARAQIVTRTPTVACGLPIAEAVLRRLDPDALMEAVTEGTLLEGGAPLARLSGDARAILTAERCVLNILMRLCAVATATRDAVQYLPAGTRTQIYDTRKTLPGMRLLDKYAVRVGGGQNHRLGLFDAILIKDNHLALVGSIAAAVKRARAHAPQALVEVEVDSLEQLAQAVVAGADIVLLDNFTDAMVERAVSAHSGVTFEVSGGVDVSRIPRLAQLGVQRISLGRLTHSALPPDLSLEILT